MDIKHFTKRKRERLAKALYKGKTVLLNDLPDTDPHDHLSKKKFNSVWYIGFDVTHLVKLRKKDEGQRDYQWRYSYRSDLLSLIIIGDAEHPGNFLKYKALIDLVIEKYGWKDVFCTYNKDFNRFEESGVSGEFKPFFSDIERKIHISKEMQTYFRRLEIHADKFRKQTNALLTSLRTKAKTNSPDKYSEYRMAMQQARREVVAFYRVRHPKTEEAEFSNYWHEIYTLDKELTYKKDGEFSYGTVTVRLPKCRIRSKRNNLHSLSDIQKINA